MRLRVGHQHSQFWPILTRFMDYYSSFWGPEAISIVFEGPTCRPSRVAVLADFGPFLGLLLTVFWSRGAFHVDELGVRLCVGHQYSRFLSILARLVAYYSLFWDPKAIFMVAKPQGALTCLSSTIAVWADSRPFLELFLSFGVPE